ncbi:adhesin [Prevotella melaninogenica]|uniref:Adhesin n=2 Tax=Prevotella melaninogenica TaxID=28132 RepID=A0A7D4KF73_9BACT|nr:adhesin [Prevotella melaninogenica]
MAQGQNANHVWNGNPLNNIVNKTDDMGTVYLYNVGTGKYLNTGSYWGTVVIGFNVGMTTHVQTTSTTGVYTMTGPLETTEGKYIAFGRQMDTPGYDNFINYNRVYVDRGVDFTDHYTNTKHKNGILNWKIEKTGDGSNTYYIHCTNDETRADMGGEIYLSMAHTGTGKTYEVTYPRNTPDGNYSKWKFVTKKDLKDDFKDTYASDEEPSDATFLIYDQNFERGNIYVEHWKESDGLKSAYAKKNGQEIKYIFDPSSSNYTYYVGNGAISSNYYMAQYAGYTTANVRNVGNNANANGKIIQSVQTIKKGWYKVTCNGFYNRGNGSNMVSKLFARVQGTNTTISNVSTELNKFNKEFSYTKADMLKVYDGANLPTGSDPLISPYVNAGMQFEMGKYNNTVLVYVPNNNSTLDIGIEISNSTDELDWTCWDNVQLQYCGSNDLVLDEGQENVRYIQLQVNPSTSGTLILKRTMKTDTWSSVMLPVNLTAGQVKTAFGENVKLSHHPKQHNTVKTRIEFKSVDLSNDDDVAIKANELYLIKPTKVPTGFNQEDPYEKQLKDGSKIKVKAPYYVINSVSLKTDPSTLGNYTNGVIKESATTSTTADEKLQFCGSVINQTGNVVPANSYALGSNDGKWYFTQNALPVKGFRCWIATGSEAYAKTIRFFIDGIEEDMVTGIDNVVVENSNNEVMGTVYNLNGQVVRAGATSLEGLPKGIYIVNNKKYIVK